MKSDLKLTKKVPARHGFRHLLNHFVGPSYQYINTRHISAHWNNPLGTFLPLPKSPNHEPFNKS